MGGDSPDRIGNGKYLSPVVIGVGPYSSCLITIGQHIAVSIIGELFIGPVRVIDADKIIKGK